MHMKERLYLTEDRKTAVYSSDRRGRHLLCKQGAHLDDKEAKKYGLMDGRLSALQPAGTKVKRPERKVKEAIKEEPKAKEARLKREAEIKDGIIAESKGAKRKGGLFITRI